MKRLSECIHDFRYRTVTAYTIGLDQFNTPVVKSKSVHVEDRFSKENLGKTAITAAKVAVIAVAVVSLAINLGLLFYLK